MFIPARWKFLAVNSLVALITFPALAQEDPYVGGRPPGEGPLEVLIGFNVVDITDVNEREETIDFVGAIYLNWHDPRLAYDPVDVGMAGWTPGDYSQTPQRIYQGDFAVKELFEGWRPHVVIANGIGDRMKTNMAIMIWPDGMVEYAESFYAKVETPMDLRRYPFDDQTLSIYFHPFIYQREEIVLVPDDSLARIWNQNQGIAEWTRKAAQMEEQPAEIIFFDGTKGTISQFVVTIQLNRHALHILTSIIFPMILLVALTWCVFWMDSESLSTRINITFIGILSVIAYYLVIFSDLPKSSYLTLMDAFVITTFLILAADVVLAVIADTRQRRGDRHMVRKFDRVCRWAFPGAYALTTAILGLIFFSLY